MTASKRWDGRSNNGRNDGVSFLVQVDPPMPTTPDLGRSEHTTTATHVSEGSLTSTMGTTTGDTGDTGHGATGTPGLEGGLVSSLFGHDVLLALVVRDLGADEVDDVGPDEGFHDIGQSDGGDGIGGHVTFEGLDSDKGTHGGYCGGHWRRWGGVRGKWGLRERE